MDDDAYWTMLQRLSDAGYGAEKLSLAERLDEALNDLATLKVTAVEKSCIAEERGLHWADRIADAERELQEARWAHDSERANQLETRGKQDLAERFPCGTRKIAEARVIRAEVALEKAKAGR